MREQGQRILGWRNVPVDPSTTGPACTIVDARDPAGVPGRAGRARQGPDALERKLYVIRKTVENEVRASKNLRDAESFYVPELLDAHHLLQGPAAAGADPPRSTRICAIRTFVSALALVHQRFSTNTFPSWGPRAPVPLHRAQRRDQQAARHQGNWMVAREKQFASAALR